MLGQKDHTLVGVTEAEIEGVVQVLVAFIREGIIVRRPPGAAFFIR